MNHLYPNAQLVSSTSTLKWTTLAVTMLLVLSNDTFSQKNVSELSSPASVQSFLPGTLINLNVKIDKNKVMVSWTTTMEKNSVNFTVQKSVDGVEYTDAGTLEAAGNSNIRKNYAFTEKQNIKTNKLLYYRLKLTDIDENIKLSDVRTIRGNQPEGVMLQLFPNPTVSELKVNIPGAWLNESLQINVYNMNGLLVRTTTTIKGKEIETINVRDLAKGMYLVKLSNGTLSSMEKFIKN